MSEPASKGRILFASVGALCVALTLLVTAILPAEYGWDPLGTGAALGLLGMAQEDARVLKVQEHPWSNDRIVFQLAPFESVEYKYRLAAGASLLFDWSADGEVLYELHAEPDGAAPGYAESFDKSRGSGARGSYVAPFEGIHGWYWQNREPQEVTVVLETSGFYDEAVEMRDGREFRYELRATVEE